MVQIIDFRLLINEASALQIKKSLIDCWGIVRSAARERATLKKQLKWSSVGAKVRKSH
jgi:hypothetical protein